MAASLYGTVWPSAKRWRSGFLRRSYGPPERAARSQARSVAAEMHSGFAELRAALPMDIVARRNAGQLEDAVKEQIGRILAIWHSALTQFGGHDGFLFGPFSIADAFYAPVVTRFVTHGIEIPALQQGYANRILELPAMRQWASEAHAEMAAAISDSGLA